MSHRAHMRRALIAGGAVLALARALPAQASPDTVGRPTRVTAPVYVYLQYGDTLAFEAVYIDTAFVRGAYLEPKKQRITWNHLVSNGTPGSLGMSVYATDTSLFSMQDLSFVPKADSLQLLVADPGGRRRETVPVKPGTVATFSRSMTQLAYLGFLAAQRGEKSIPLFLISSGKSVDATIDVTGELLTIIAGPLRIESEWNGALLEEVRVPSQGLVVRRLP